MQKSLHKVCMFSVECRHCSLQFLHSVWTAIQSASVFSVKVSIWSELAFSVKCRSHSQQSLPVVSVNPYSVYVQCKIQKSSATVIACVQYKMQKSLQTISVSVQCSMQKSFPSVIACGQCYSLQCLRSVWDAEVIPYNQCLCSASDTEVIPYSHCLWSALFPTVSCVQCKMQKSVPTISVCVQSKM